MDGKAKAKAVDKPVEFNTISQKDVVDTLRSLEYGYHGYEIKDDRLEGAYIFASELTGLSVDTLGTMVLGN